MSNQKRVKSQVFDITRTYDNCADIMNSSRKTLESTAEVFRSYQSKTGAGFFNELVGILEAHIEPTKKIANSLEEVRELALKEHREKDQIISSLNL